MNYTTLNKILALNKAFYDNMATEFSSTRQSEWSGWYDILHLIKSLKRPKILDLGCGNGRFCRFLQDNKVEFSSYLGIDASISLINIAKESITDVNVSFEVADVLSYAPSDSYDFIAVYGVMHHIPSGKLRVDFISKLARLISNSGIVAMSFWDFLDNARYKDKIYNSIEKSISKTDLEENDYFMNFDNRGLRYCHYYSKKEKAKVISEFKNLGLRLIDNYKPNKGSDVDNVYLIFKK